MYWDRELIRLAAHKTALRRRIALRRTQCAAAAVAIGRPLAWLDRIRAFWGRLSPLTRLAAAPVSLLVTRVVFPRWKMLGRLARWGPLAFGVVRAIRSGLKSTPTIDRAAAGSRVRAARP